jgi:hypothetical protein
MALCKKPWVQSLTHIRIPAVRLNAGAIKSLIDSPHLKRLRGVDIVAGSDVPEKLSRRFYRRFLRHLVRSPHA